MQMGVGSETITHHGQLKLPVTFVYNDIVAREEPIYWAITDEGDAAVLSQHRDVITTTLGLSVCGVTVPDAALEVGVPTAVFDTIPAVSPGTPIEFHLTTRLARAGGILVVPETAEIDPESRFTR